MKKPKKADYEKFHQNTAPSLKIISKSNFTYKIILKTFDKYINKNEKILDIGCGAGTLALYYTSRGNKVLGIDISNKAIVSARKSIKILNMKDVEFKIMNFPIQIPKEKFDRIICSEVIEHLEDDILALNKVYKLLKPKGKAIITTPSKNAPLYKLGYAKGFDKRVGHLRRYTIEELMNKSQKVGFKIIETKKTEGIIRNFLYLNPFAGKFIRFIKYFVVDIVLGIDWLSMKLFGESDLIIVLEKP